MEKARSSGTVLALRDLPYADFQQQMHGCEGTAAGQISASELEKLTDHCTATLESMLGRIAEEVETWSTISTKAEPAAPVSPAQDRVLKICGMIEAYRDISCEQKE